MTFSAKEAKKVAEEYISKQPVEDITDTVIKEVLNTTSIVLSIMAIFLVAIIIIVLL